MTARRVVLVALVLVGLGTVAMVWLGLTARSAQAELTAARDDLVEARDAISERDAATAAARTQSAAEHAAAARSDTGGPVWALAAGLPWLGDTPQAVRAITTALDEAVSALEPAISDVAGLSADTLLGPDGSIDGGAAIDAALPLLQAADQGITSAIGTLDAAPSRAQGDLVAGPVDSARTELLEQLVSLEQSLESIVAVAEIAPPLLGLDGPRRYFVGLLNPNEARGTGGFIGNWAILRADDGRLKVQQVGSNGELPSFQELPIDLGEEFESRYGRDANELGNFNLSPHFPNAAQLWLASWEAKTGEKLDGAISADVVAMGDLIDAVGRRVPLPDGGEVDGRGLTDLALTGVYERFPSGSESPERDVFQEAVAAAAIEAVTEGLGADPGAFASALGHAIAERRVLAWVPDEELEEKILATPLGGSLAVPDGPDVAFVALNAAASKLDAYLTREVLYEVGQCPRDDGMVGSRFRVTLTNDVPRGGVPPYVAGNTTVPDRPVSSMLAQVHLPNGARLLSVSLDGDPAFHSPFTEQGRPSTVLGLALQPRESRTLTVEFLEPLVDRDPAAPAQPLNRAVETTITPLGC